MSSETLTISALLGRGRFEQPLRGCAVWRYYDPQMGQFLTVDPLVDETLAPYGYANDNPVTDTDSTGFCSESNRGTAAGDQRRLASASGSTILIVTFDAGFGQSAHALVWTGSGRITMNWTLVTKNGRVYETPSASSDGCAAAIAPCLNHFYWDPTPYNRVIRLKVTATYPTLLFRWSGSKYPFS